MKEKNNFCSLKFVTDFFMCGVHNKSFLKNRWMNLKVRRNIFGKTASDVEN